MEFISATIQNFMSIKQGTINLQNQGLVLVQGVNEDDTSFESNGAGKSNTLESIVWVLFDKTLKGVKADDVVNKYEKKNCMVSLKLKDDNGDEYVITRYRKSSKHKNNVFIYKNGTEITGKSIKDTNEAIVNLIQMDFDTFTSSVIYSGKNFHFTTATDAEMKKAFDTILGLELLTQCRDVAKSKLNKTEQEKVVVEREIQLYQSQLQQGEQKLKSLKIQQQQFEQEIDVKIKNAQDNVVQAQKDLGHLEQQDTSIPQQLESLQKELQNLNDQINSLSALKDAKNKLILEFGKKQNSINFSKDNLIRLSKNYDQIQEDITHTQQSGVTCPTCGQNLPESAIADTIKSLMEKQTQAQTEIEKCLGDIKKLKEECAKIQATQKKVDEEIDQNQSVADKYMQVNTTITQLRSEQTSQTKFINQQKTLVMQLQQQVQELLDSKQNNHFDRLVKEEQESIKELKEAIKTNKERVLELNEKYDKYQFWITAFGNQGIKSYILDNITPFLNEHANNYIQKLASGIEIEFSTQETCKNGTVKDKFSLSVLNNTGGDNYQANSGGEQKRIDIAVNMALQDLVATRSHKQINFAWYDEAFDALDAIGTEKVVELLGSMNKQSIFVTTHNSHLKTFFSNTLTIKKQNGNSTII